MRTTPPSRPPATRARRFPPAPVAPDAIVPRRSRRAAPSRAPAPPPEPSSGWRRSRTQSAAPAPPARREPPANGGNPAAYPETPAAAGSSNSVWSMNLSMLCLVMPVNPFALSSSKARESCVQFLANRFHRNTGLQPRQSPVPGRVVADGPRMHHRGYEDVGHRAGLRAGESAPGRLRRFRKARSPMRNVRPMTFASRPKRRVQ